MLNSLLTMIDTANRYISVYQSASLSESLSTYYTDSRVTVCYSIEYWEVSG